MQYPWQHTDSSLSIELLKSNMSDYFIETGTNTGFGVLKALEAGFKHIISIDIEDEFVVNAKSRFNEELYPQIKFDFWHGDSGVLMPQMISEIKTPATFWLDGHSFHQIPLLKELEAIRNHHIKEHILLIDDVRMFNTHEWDNVGHSNIVDLVKSINKNYKITYYDSYNGKNDILIAKV